MLKRKLIRENFANQEAYINAFLASKGSSKTYEDYKTGKLMVFGGKHLSMPMRAKELGIGKSTLYAWDKDYEKEQQQ